MKLGAKSPGKLRSVNDYKLRAVKCSELISRGKINDRKIQLIDLSLYPAHF